MSEYVPTPLPDDVRWGFTRKGLKTLLHYIHPIPLGRGLTQNFVRHTWPGLSFSDALNFAKYAGAWVPDESRFPPITVGPLVKELHVLHDGSTRIIEFTPEEAEAVAIAEKPKREKIAAAASFLVPARELSDMTEDELTQFLIDRLSGR